jgi:hypothetical protein
MPTLKEALLIESVVTSFKDHSSRLTITLKEPTVCLLWSGAQRDVLNEVSPSRPTSLARNNWLTGSLEGYKLCTQTQSRVPNRHN